MSRSGIMLCYPFEEKRLAKWSPPYIVQPKLDGERCRYLPTPNGSLLLSSEENPFFSVPHIKTFLDNLNIQTELDGELYCKGMPFEEIHSRVSRIINIHDEYTDIKFYVFDVVTHEPQIVRTKNLLGLTGLLEQGPIRIVPSYLCYDLEGIMRRYDQIISEGYEGIIVRHTDAPYVRKRSTYMMKFKPKKSDEYEIIGFNEEISINGEPKGTLGSLVCKGDDGTEFKVGTGFTADDRFNYWMIRWDLIGMRVEVSYQHLTHGQGVPRFPVFVRVI